MRKFRGSGWGEGVSRPTAKGEVEGDLVQAHTQGGNLGGSGWGVPAPRGDTCGGACFGGGGDPLVTATAVGGTHPTGMHSCLIMCLHLVDINLYRSGTVNLNTVNSKFHLIRSFFEIFVRFLSFHV